MRNQEVKKHKTHLDIHDIIRGVEEELMCVPEDDLARKYELATELSFYKSLT